MTKHKHMKSTFLTVCALLSSAYGSFAQVNCEGSGYIFKDQKNFVYPIKSMRECYGYYDKDTEKAFPKNKNKCYLEEEINNLIDKLHTKNDVRSVGERLIEILYQDKTLYIVEEKVIGSPFLVYEVQSSIKNTDYKSFRPSNMKYGLYDGEKSIDFTSESAPDEAYAKESYKFLFGKKLTYEKCN
jgi:hypothetical protein